MKLYSGLLLQNTPWPLLLPPYSLDAFPKQRPFSIDTQFGKISRPAISLQSPQQAAGGSSTLGVRNLVVSSGGRELSLMETMLSSSMSAETLWGVGIGKSNNSVMSKTRQRALGTLRGVLATQRGVTLVKQTRAALTQLGTIAMSQGQTSTSPESPAPLEALLSELAESAATDQSINAQLWDGWGIAGQTELLLQTKRIQGALLGRSNRIEGEDTVDSIVIWDLVNK